MKLEEFLQWIADLFEEPAENITMETLRIDIDAWDSLGILTLMAELDEKYDIMLSEDDIQELQKVGDILDLLKKHGKVS